MALILERRIGERVRIAKDIFVQVAGVRGNRVKLSFDAPTDIPIKREEICELGGSGKEDESGQRRSE